MKYAIVEHSGRQYLAQEGGLIEVDRMSLGIGKPVVFKEVLLVTDGKKVEVGTPYVKGASVKGKVQDHAKGTKITVFKYKPKQRYRRKQGHRQLLTHISIESVGLPKAEPKKKKKAQPKRKSTTAKGSKAGTTKKSAAAKKKPTSKAGSKSKATKKD